MNIDDVRTLLDYHYWARDRVLEALQPLAADQYTRDLGNSFRSLRDTVVHVYAAEWAWYSRWQGESPTALLPPDRFPDVATIRDAWTSLETKVRAYVAAMGPDGIHKELPYRLLNGTAGSSVLSQMIQHVVNHASYHRGQITTMLRQIGANPPKSMDLIAFHRLRAPKQEPA